MEDRFYYADDQRISLKPSSAFVAVRVMPEADKNEILSAVGKEKAMGNAQDVEELFPFDVLLVPASKEVTSERLESSAAALLTEPSVSEIIPVFQIPEGEADEVMVLIPQFRVQFRQDVTEEQIDRLNKKHGVEVIEKDDVMPKSYLLRVTSKAKKDALDLANLYHQSDLTEYAEPDWLYKVKQIEAFQDIANGVEILETIPAVEELETTISEAPIERMAAAVNDPHFPDQWALKKMNVVQAWGIHKGRPSIKIAIVDEGVQTSHPDFAGKIVTPYDAVGNDNNQEPNSWDGHGTACAGIAAATTNNVKGIAGVAAGCKIMPIRIAYSSRPRANWTTTATWIARGIRIAVDRGADVISNSWGGGPYSTTIRNALKYARSKGRGGKGCVIISATGNSDVKGIIYPAKYPESLACGASNEWDQRKSRTSLDGETWWGSNYGPEMDFVAPGVHIYTTDIRGAGGYGSGVLTMFQ